MNTSALAKSREFYAARVMLISMFMGLACDQSEVGIASHEAGSRLPIQQGASQECVIEDISSPQCPFAGGRRSHAPGSQRVSNEFRPGMCSYWRAHDQTNDPSWGQT